MKIIRVEAIDYLGRTAYARNIRAKNWGQAGDIFRKECFKYLDLGQIHTIRCTTLGEEVDK